MNDLGLSRAAAESRRTGAPRRRAFKADCWVLDVGGRRVFVKDYARTTWAFRWTLGRLQLRREARAYRALAGLPFVPRCFGRLDGDALLIEQVDGVPLTHEARARMAPDFFERLNAAIDAVHARGILHNDLRHRRNILVGEDGGPRLVDFASSVYLGGGGPRRLLLHWLRFLDRSAAIKWKWRHAPKQLTESERGWYRRYLWLRRLWPSANPRLANPTAPEPTIVLPPREDATPHAPAQDACAPPATRGAPSSRAPAVQSSVCR